VEICVIGTSDMGGRGVTARRPLPATKSKSPFGARPEPVPAPPRVTPAEELAAVKAELKAVHATKAAQDEFGFGEVESRGHFEKTDRNLFDGQDLDVPTYLRRGVKISI
jgi:cell division protein FtsZ